MDGHPLRLAVLGAGAVAELCHLPAVASLPDVEVSLLVDTNVDRAQALASQFGIARVAVDYHQAFADIDGVVNALPHNMHAPVTLELIEHGIPVLVEKPLAISGADAAAIAQAAASAELPVQPGYMYRLCRGPQFVKGIVEGGLLGALQSFELESGFIYDWPASSSFFFDRRRAGGGVLIDSGSHFLDLLLWWLGPAESVDYRDDNAGGIEADCELELVLGGVQGRVTLSRIRNLPDVVTLVGERFTLEYDLSTPDGVRLWATGKPDALNLASASLHLQSWPDVYAEQLRTFGAAIRRTNPAPVIPDDVLPAVDLIERCYLGRKAIMHAWTRSSRELLPA